MIFFNFDDFLYVIVSLESFLRIQTFRYLSNEDRQCITLSIKSQLNEDGQDLSVSLSPCQEQGSNLKSQKSRGYVGIPNWDEISTHVQECLRFPCLQSFTYRDNQTRDRHWIGSEKNKFQRNSDTEIYESELLDLNIFDSKIWPQTF